MEVTKVCSFIPDFRANAIAMVGPSSIMHKLCPQAIARSAEPASD